MRRMCSSSKPGQVEGVRGTRNGRGGCRGVLVRCPVGSYAAGGYCRQTSQRGGHGKSPPALLVLANYVRGARRARARVVTSLRTLWRDPVAPRRPPHRHTHQEKQSKSRKVLLQPTSAPTSSKRIEDKRSPISCRKFFSTFHTHRDLPRLSSKRRCDRHFTSLAAAAGCCRVWPRRSRVRGEPGSARLPSSRR